VQKIYGKMIEHPCQIQGKPFAAFVSNDKFIYLRNWQEYREINLNLQDMDSVSTMTSYSRGFLVGYEFKPQIDVIHIDEYSEEPSIVKSINLKVPHLFKCLSIDVSPDELTVVCSV
jgi:hypothetical protein